MSNLYPNPCLSSSSLLAPNIPDQFHRGFCIDDAIDKPLKLFEQAKTPIAEFTRVGELLVQNGKISLEMTTVLGEHDIRIGLRAEGVDLWVSYPKGTLSPQHMVWQLLMHRSLVLKET